MRVILLDNVIGLGKAGDIKSVRDGYARNYLLPNKLVEMSTKSNEKRLQKIAAVLAEKAKKFYESAVSLKEAVEKEEIEIKAKAGEEGKLFGSITSSDLAGFLKERGFEIDKKKILMEHIKTIGDHSAKVRLDEGVSATIKIKIIQE